MSMLMDFLIRCEEEDCVAIGCPGVGARPVACPDNSFMVYSLSKNCEDRTDCRQAGVSNA